MSRRRRFRGATTGGAAGWLAATALVTVLGVLAVIGGGPGSAGADRVGGPLRILVVGDSITTGQTGSATWRYWLWRELRRQGVAAQFVGPNEELARGSWFEHVDHGFGDQRAHGAFPGRRYAHYLGLAGDTSITELIAAHDPDVVLAQLGFNDANTIADRTTDERLAARARRFVRAVEEADPDVRLVLGEVPSTARTPPPYGDRFARVKNAISARADRLIDAWLADGHPRVWRTRLRTHPDHPWDPARHTYDGSHPNPYGETLMAQHMAAALHRMGVLPRPPRVTHAERWEAAPVPDDVRVGPAGVVVRWREDATRVDADAYHAVVRLDGERRVFRPGPSGRLVLPLPPGTHTFRLVALRGSTISLPGPAQVVTVPEPDAPSVHVVGDSLSWQSRGVLARLHPSWTVDARRGRFVDLLPERVGAHLMRQGPPDVLVVALGTNSRASWGRRDYERVAAMLPPRSRIVYVTPYRARDNPGPVHAARLARYARVMQQMVAADPGRVCLAPWRRAVLGEPGLLADGVHPTPAGRRVWARLVSRAVQRCTPPSDAGRR